MMRWNDLLVLIDVVGRLASREESDWIKIPERKKNAITKTSERSALYLSIRWRIGIRSQHLNFI